MNTKCTNEGLLDFRPWVRSLFVFSQLRPWVEFAFSCRIIFILGLDVGFISPRVKETLLFHVRFVRPFTSCGIVLCPIYDPHRYYHHHQQQLYCRHHADGSIPQIIIRCWYANTSVVTSFLGCRGMNSTSQ